MRILIEYYKFDTLIEGREVDKKELKKMFEQAIKMRRRNGDGFAELFCGMFDYKIVKVLKEARIREDYDFVLDIDTDLVLVCQK
jgi:hypothetical protein